MDWVNIRSKNKFNGQRAFWTCLKILNDFDNSKNEKTLLIILKTGELLIPITG